MEIKTARNPKQARIDGSRFGLRKQKLWLKRNFPKMAKMAISGPKRRNSAKKGYAFWSRRNASTARVSRHSYFNIRTTEILLPLNLG